MATSGSWLATVAGICCWTGTSREKEYLHQRDMQAGVERHMPGAEFPTGPSSLGTYIFLLLFIGRRDSRRRLPSWRVVWARNGPWFLGWFYPVPLLDSHNLQNQPTTYKLNIPKDPPKDAAILSVFQSGRKSCFQDNGRFLVNAVLAAMLCAMCLYCAESGTQKRSVNAIRLWTKHNGSNIKRRFILNKLKDRMTQPLLVQRRIYCWEMFVEKWSDCASIR